MITGVQQRQRAPGSSNVYSQPAYRLFDPLDFPVGMSGFDSPSTSTEACPRHDLHYLSRPCRVFDPLDTDARARRHCVDVVLEFMSPVRSRDISVSTGGDKVWAFLTYVLSFTRPMLQCWLVLCLTGMGLAWWPQCVRCLCACALRTSHTERARVDDV